MGIGISARLVPVGYKNIASDDDEALPLGKYPVCGWSGNAFINWLTQNSVNMATNLTFSLLGGGSKGGTESVTSISSTVANTIGQFYSATLLPSIEGSGQNTGDIIFSANKICFTFKQMRVKKEYLQIIDEYFSRFGYAINRVKIPNLTGRKSFNYVEIGPNENIGNGSVPQKFMDIINSIARKGVTIWHNHDNIGNYNIDNSII